MFESVLNTTHYLAHKCPPILRNTIPLGGGNCTENEDCNDAVGGACTNGKCECYSGWGCSHCTEALASMEGNSNI